MYNNIGRKIKMIARWICIIGVVISCLAGFIYLGVGLIRTGQIIPSESFADVAWSFASSIFVGLLIAGLGSLSSWLGTLLLYALGQQVEMQEKSAIVLEEIHALLRDSKLTSSDSVQVDSAEHY